MRRTLAIGVTGLVFLLTGCSQDFVPPSTEGVPPDFSIEFSVQGDSDSSDQVALAARYLLLPNRQFRVLEGTKAIDRTYPALLRTLTPREFANVYHYVNDNGIDGGANFKPKTMDSWPTTMSSVLYMVKIVANGNTKRYTVPKDAAPDLEGLLKVLTDLEKQ